MSGDFAERCETPLIALDGDDARRAKRQQGARQAAWTWADFDNDAGVFRIYGAGNARCKIEIEKKILAERLFSGKSMRGDDVAERGQVV
jgi:hypothetical protein